jgi:hypothetical protein
MSRKNPRLSEAAIAVEKEEFELTIVEAEESKSVSGAAAKLLPKNFRLNTTFQ